MTDEPVDSIAYRMRRADECVAEARILSEAGHWNAAVNRLYYACFYAVSALLLTKGMSPAKHSGVRSMFGRHFVKGGDISREAASVFNELFEKRQQSDYEDFFEADPQKVEMLTPRVQNLISNVKTIVNT